MWHSPVVLLVTACSSSLVDYCNQKLLWHSQKSKQHYDSLPGLPQIICLTNNIRINAELALVATEKKDSLLKAWEESERSKVENRAQKKLAAIGAWVW
ncbi:Remorin, C-terminal [Artemisia annua]|uniref:Remorin, C-terminal n=1 Tax=Artemisia annua TaxID=35608 RepID=A0A2U1PIE1_ARTAN|nr:Remorin, C-terminal [Artemisia annua]